MVIARAIHTHTYTHDITYTHIYVHIYAISTWIHVQLVMTLVFDEAHVDHAYRIFILCDHLNRQTLQMTFLAMNKRQIELCIQKCH